MLIRKTIFGMILALAVWVCGSALLTSNHADAGDIPTGGGGSFALLDASDGSAPRQVGRARVSVVGKLSQGEPEVLVMAGGALESRVEAPDGRTYSQLSIPGCGRTAKAIGMPVLPFKGFFLEVPYAVDVSVEVLDQAARSLGKGFLIYPAQEPPLDSSSSGSGFQIDEKVYKTNSFLPESPVVIEAPGFIRGRRVVFVQVFPLQYNPVSGELLAFSSLRFRLVFTGTPDVSGEARKTRLATRQSEMLAKNLILNYEAIKLGVSDGDKGKSGPGGGGIGFQPLGFSQGPEPNDPNGADYLVIVVDDLYDEIAPLAEWKHMKGFITHVTKTSEIDDDPNKYDIEKYIENAYDNWNPAPSYVLLVGDSGDVPSHYYSGSYACTSDHVYACVDGSDYYADLTIARLPVHTGTECNDVVNKILIYDCDPNTADWYESFLSAAYFQGYQTASRAFMQTLAYMKDFLGDTVGMTPYTAWTTTSTYDPSFQSTGSWDPNYICYYRDGTQVPQEVTDLWEIPTDATDSIIDAINTGVGLVEHRDHGGITGWSHPSFTNSHVNNNLDNGEMTPVVLSINCSTGSFQYGSSGSNDCLCEAFLKKSNGGCVGIVGPTRTSPSFANNELTNGINTCFWPSYDPDFAYDHWGYPIEPNYDPNDNYYELTWRPGEALNYGKYHVLGRMGADYVVEGEFYMYHYFGDPEMMLRTKTPESLSVSHHKIIATDLSTAMDLTVTVSKDSSPVEGALVAITHPDVNEDYWTGYTDANGSVTFSNIVFSDASDYDIVVTARDCIPYEDLIAIYSTIQGAIDDANDGDEIIACATTFYERINFEGKAITLRSTDPEDANVVAATVIDGDDGGTVVKFITSEDGNSVLNGFTITGGYGLGGGEYSGGIYCSGTSPTISNCVIKDNYVGSTYGFGSGGGMRNTSSSNPTVTNCTFSGNWTNGFGGAMGNWSQSQPKVTNCTFVDNYAPSGGGGMANYEASPTVTNCTFSLNSCGNIGGAMYNAHSSAKVSNCVFSDNTVGAPYGMGGGMYLCAYSPVEVENCLFSRNIATNHGGGMYLCFSSHATVTNCTFGKNSAGESGGAVRISESSDPKFTNCVIWGNSAGTVGDEVSKSFSCDADFSFSDVNGCGGSDNWDPNFGIDGGGNIDADPLFVDVDANDFHIEGNSPCVNGGDPSGDYEGQTDIDGEPRVQAGRVDIGADETCCAIHNVTQNEWYSTIQGAIDDANNGDEIEVRQGTYYENVDFGGMAITVRSTDPNDASIVAATIIDGNGSGNVVTFNSSEGADSVLQGFTIKGSNYGVYCSSASPTISRCAIKDNTYYGVYCYSGSPTISKCLIDNHSYYGVYCYFTSVTIENCTIQKNNYYGIYAYGATSPTIRYNEIRENNYDGIYLSSSGATVKSNWIYDNNRYGIRTYNSNSATLRNNTIVGNTSAGVYKSGGTEPSISNCILWDNNDDLYGCTATYSCIQDGDAGTGNFSSDPCFVDADSNDFHLTARAPCIGVGDPSGDYSGETDIDGESRVQADRVDIGADETPWAVVVHNITSGLSYTAIQYAIDDAASGDVIEVDQGTHYENLDFKGRAITVRSTDPNEPNVVAATIIDGNDSGSVVTFNSSETSSSVLEGLTITNGNRGIYCYYSSPTISKCVITGNTTTGTDDGAGMYNDNSDPNVLNCTFSNNQADDGGGMYNYYSDPVVNNCAFTDNNSADDGGGMYNYYSDPNVANSTFTDNNSTDNGAGMYNRHSDASVLNCTFSANISADDGGGMYNDYGQPIVCNCTFSGNSADDEGGGMYNEDCEVIVDDCVFAQNTAYYDGGGIYNEDIDSTSKITSSVFWANSADDGGGIANGSSDHDILNCTFFDNDAADDGGAIYNSGSDGDIANCIFWQNSAGGSGDDIYNSSTSNPYMHSNFYDDPDFLDENDLDGPDNLWRTCDDGLNLDSTSDCIDEGDTDDAEEDYDDLDIKGSDRELGSDPDIGAYEYDSGC